MSFNPNIKLDKEQFKKLWYGNRVIMGDMKIAKNRSKAFESDWKEYQSQFPKKIEKKEEV